MFIRKTLIVPILSFVVFPALLNAKEIRISKDKHINTGNISNMVTANKNSCAVYRKVHWNKRAGIGLYIPPYFKLNISCEEFSKQLKSGVVDFSIQR